MSPATRPFRPNDSQGRLWRDCCLLRHLPIERLALRPDEFSDYFDI